MPAPKYSIILAAGKGTRMNSDTTPKVCFPVNGVPAILRAMHSYAETGVNQFIVVVGALAGSVISTVSSEFQNVVYACQPEQNGTAGAVSCAINGLSTIADNDDLLIVAGDRLIDKDVLAQFFAGYFNEKSDFSLLVLEQNTPSSAGHILNDSQGRPMAIVEMADVRQRRAWGHLQDAVRNGETSRTVLLDIMCTDFFPAEAVPNASKAKKAFGSVWDALNDSGVSNVGKDVIDMILAAPSDFSFNTADGVMSFSPDEVEASPLRNNSVYIVKAGVLKDALATFTRDNAQQEIYLSDLLNAVYRRGVSSGKIRTSMLKISSKNKILGFNNPSELIEVEKALNSSCIRNNADPSLFKTLPEWTALFEEAEKDGSPFNLMLRNVYGDDNDVIARQSAEMRKLAQAAVKHFAPDTPLMFVRAPGRVNAMGRHVDHQGGHCNLMTISFETMMFVACRNDDIVRMEHCDSENFPASSFSIGELLAEMPWEDWDKVINSPTLQKRVREKHIDWTDYIRAAILRTQKKFKATLLNGMDMLVGGNIPMAAGLSSSSSLIVCTTEALMHMNSLETFPNQFVALCGEGEWFVGTHGGSADHAAVKMGTLGYITKMKFFDFAIEEVMPFPAGYSMLVCDSGVKACKSSNAKDQFNHRVSCYRIGFQLIRRFFPQYDAILHYLRDVNAAHLHVPLRNIYKMLLMLPENPTRRQIEAMLPDADFDKLFAGHDSTPDRHYPIRSVVMYGLCEMQRSAKFADALKKGDIAAVSTMFRASHDGDRVVAYDDEWNQIPFAAPTDNGFIMGLMDDLESGDVDRVIRAQLEFQSGAYACSVPEIDKMVDIANRTEGVVGAQLAGAGLGGCMMILVKNDAIPAVCDNLKKLYYEPEKRNPRILVCRPVAGAGLLK